tara:strand:+ start:549 stop:794 length:246 start_codon:yes stop_codon:yes gene_type:complete
MKLATKEKTWVDPYTADLFRNYTGVSDQCSFEELIGLAMDFIITIHNDFQGISIDYDAIEYVHNYLDQEGLTLEDLPNDLN